MVKSISPVSFQVPVQKLPNFDRDKYRGPQQVVEVSKYSYRDLRSLVMAHDVRIPYAKCITESQDRFNSYDWRGYDCGRGGESWYVDCVFKRGFDMSRAEIKLKLSKAYEFERSRRVEERLISEQDNDLAVAWAFKRAQANAAYRARIRHMTAVPQSAAAAAVEARAQREHIQRKKASEKARAEFRRKYTKEEREKLVKSNRDKRTGVPTMEPQVGFMIPLAATGAMFGGTQILRACRSVVKATKKCVHEVRNTSKVVSDAAHSISSFAQRIVEALKKAADAIKSPFVLVPLVAIMWTLVFEFFAHNRTAQVLLASACCLFVGPVVWDKIANFFRGSGFNDPSTVEPQAGFVNCLPQLLTVVFTLGIFKSGVSHKTMGEAMRRVALIGRAKDGFENLVDWTMAALETLINFFRDRFGQDKVCLRKPTHPDLVKWLNDVGDLENRMLKSSSVEYYHMVRMDELLDRGNMLKKEYVKDMRMTTFLQAIISRLSGKFSHHVGAFNAADNCRVEPVLAMIYGDPGIGKTMLLQYMATAILTKSGVMPPDVGYDELIANIWQKGSSKYWEGYVRQRCLVLDDFGQERFIATGDGNPAMDIIRAVSNWAYPLDMANAELKGKFSFNTPLILGTTNHMSLRVVAEAGCHFPEAMMRRFRFSYHMTVKPEYRIPGSTRLDFAKYQEEKRKCRHNKGLDCHPFYMWEVRKHDFLRGQTEPEILGIKDLIETISLELGARTRQHLNDVDELGQFIGNVQQEVASHPLSDIPNFEAQAGCESVEPEVSFDNQAELESIRAIAAEKWRDSNRLAREGSKIPLCRKVDLLALYRRVVDLDFEEGKREALQWHQWLRIVGISVLFTCAIKMVIKLALGALFGAITGLFSFLAIRPKNKKRYSGAMPHDGKKNKNSKKEKKSVEPTVEPNSNVNVRGLGALPAKPFVVRDPTVEAQAGDVKVMNNIVANGWKLFTKNGNIQNTYGQVTYLTSNLAMMPYHFYTALLEQSVLECGASLTEVQLVNNLLPQHLFKMPLSEFMDQEVHIVVNRDVCFIKMRHTFAPRCVIQNFLKEEDLKHITGKRVRLDVNEFITPTSAAFPLMRADHADCYWWKDEIIYNDVRLERGLAYDFPVSRGDCGSALTLVDPKHFSGRFGIGMHIATPLSVERRGLAGLSTIITQELIVEACKKLGIVVDRFKDTMVAQGIECSDEYDMFMPDSGSFLPICRINKAYPLPVRSKYFPTALNGAIGLHNLRPAVLSPVFRDGELVYPMHNAVRPYSSPIMSLDRSKMKQALHVALQPFNRWSKHRARSLFTFEEAVLGIPSLKFRSIPRGTSAGFPYVFHVRKGKVEFFGEEQDYDLTTPAAIALRAEVAEINAAAARGERMGHVFLDFLKDELRKPEKIEAVATRLISSAPLALTVSTRQYCGAFCAAVMESPVSCGLAPGINVYTEWNGLAGFLQRKGKCVFAGDVKGLDASEQVDLLTLIVDMMNSWYDDGPENAQVRSILLMELYHSRHLGGDGRDQSHIYQWNKSLPSGHPLTTIVNSIYTLAGLVACYIEATGDQTFFWEHVNSITYGDDNVSNVDDVSIDRFNQVTVAKHMKDLLGIVFTSDKKDGVLISHTSLEGVTFLKRAFFRDRDYIYNAPLELDSFLYTFYWSRNKKDEQLIIDDALETALSELSLHPQDVWDVNAPKILRLIYARSGNLATRNHPDRLTYRDIVRQRGDSWY